MDWLPVRAPGGEGVFPVPHRNFQARDQIKAIGVARRPAPNAKMTDERTDLGKPTDGQAADFAPTANAPDRSHQN